MPNKKTYILVNQETADYMTANGIEITGADLMIDNRPVQNIVEKLLSKPLKQMTILESVEE